MNEKKVIFIKENGKRIAGEIYFPEDCSGKCPAVILSHGYTGNYRDLIDQAKLLSDNGFVSVIFDFCGGGPATYSDGTMLDMTPVTEIEDLTEVVREVQKMGEVDSEQIFLLGHSQGGFVSAFVGARLPEEIKGLVLWYPAFVIPDDSKVRLEKNQNECMGFAISPDYNSDAVSLDVYGEIGRFKGPVILIHGDHDRIVPLSYSERAREIYENASLLVIKGGDHGFAGEDLNNACQAILDFLKSSF